MGCLGTAIIASILLLIFITYFPPHWTFDVMSLFCHPVVSFISAPVSRDYTPADSGIDLITFSGLLDYFVSEFPTKNSNIRKAKWIQKINKNRS
jgi:hypothetical protein